MLAPALGHAQEVQTDFDRGIDFSRLKTYTYTEQARSPNDLLAASPMNDRRVRAALDSELVARGTLKTRAGSRIS